jgi:hypothetical protein
MAVALRSNLDIHFRLVRDDDLFDRLCHAPFDWRCHTGYRIWLESSETVDPYFHFVDCRSSLSIARAYLTALPLRGAEQHCSPEPQ